MKHSEHLAELARITDLVRHMRSELHESGLIDDEEYSALAAELVDSECLAGPDGNPDESTIDADAFPMMMEYDVLIEKINAAIAPPTEVARKEHL